MTKTLNPPKREQGQCLSCRYFWFTFDFSAPRTAKCHHKNKHNTETSNFCYDYEEIEDIKF